MLGLLNPEAGATAVVTCGTRRRPDGTINQRFLTPFFRPANRMPHIVLSSMRASRATCEPENSFSIVQARLKSVIVRIRRVHRLPYCNRLLESLVCTALQRRFAEKKRD
jgi:hypothetical protein